MSQLFQRLETPEPLVPSAPYAPLVAPVQPKFSPSRVRSMVYGVLLGVIGMGLGGWGRIILEDRVILFPASLPLGTYPQPLVALPERPTKPVPAAPKPTPTPEFTWDEGVNPDLAKRVLAELKATEAPDLGTLAPDPAAVVAAPSLMTMPLAVRQSVAALRYESHVYSSQRADRSVVLNGREYHEGDTIEGTLQLEHITPTQAIFRLGQTLFSLASLQDWAGL